jgi:hypothetical protein
MKAYWDSGSIAPRILELGKDGNEWSASWPGHFTPQGKRSWYPLDKRLGGSQGRSGQEKNSQSLPGLQPPDQPARSQELYHWNIPAPFWDTNADITKTVFPTKRVIQQC